MSLHRAYNKGSKSSTRERSQKVAAALEREIRESTNTRPGAPLLRGARSRIAREFLRQERLAAS